MRNLFLTFTLASTLASNLALAFTPTEDGLYAVFDTSMGEFTCELFFDETTQTVANFVGLAEGDLDWLRMSDGVIQTGVPYYDGLSFHRVIEGFMIQAGARTTGVGDRPGYTIYDEFIPGDSKFALDRVGVLAMANTGERNSGGAQFFVTVDPRDYLSQRHTVFGEIVEGYDIVEAISEVEVEDPSNDNYVPVVDVIINSVTIIREGAAAEAFNPLDYTWPTFEGSEIKALARDSDYALEIDLQPLFRHNVYSSQDLETWSNIGVLSRVYEDPGLRQLSLGAGLPGGDHGFWRAIKSVFEPAPDLNGYSLELTFNGSSAPPLEFNIAEDYTGVFVNSSSGDYNIYYYTWHEYGGGYVNFTAYVEEFPAIQISLEPGTSGAAQLYVNGGDLYEEMSFTLTAPE